MGLIALLCCLLYATDNANRTSRKNALCDNWDIDVEEMPNGWRRLIVGMHKKFFDNTFAINCAALWLFSFLTGISFRVIYV